MEKNVSKLNETSIKSCDEESDKEYIFEADIEYPKTLHNDSEVLTMNYHFYLKE